MNAEDTRITTWVYSVSKWGKTQASASKRGKCMKQKLGFAFSYLERNNPPKGRWIVVLYVHAKCRPRYLALFTDPEGDSCFSINQISWIKLKKVTFCKLKMSLSRNLVYTFVKCILLQIQYENDFLPSSQHWQGKVRRFLGICLYECFIYLTNFVFRKCLETRRHLGAGSKTVNRDFKSQFM